MADIKEGRKRVAVVDNLIKRLRASGELNIQPVRHFGPKYGQRHNPYANGVKKYELTGVGIYREDIACANITTTTGSTTTSNNKGPTNGASKSNGGASTAGPRQQTNGSAGRSQGAGRRTSGSSHASTRTGNPTKRSRRTAAAASSNEFLCPSNIVGDEMTSGDYLASGDSHSGDEHSLLLEIGDGHSQSDHQAIEGECGDCGDAIEALVDVDEAGQSDMYLCRLDNGFAQETTL